MNSFGEVSVKAKSLMCYFVYFQASDILKLNTRKSDFFKACDMKFYAKKGAGFIY